MNPGPRAQRSSGLATRPQGQAYVWHRAKGESLQDLYRDITRLIQLAYPGVDNVIVTHVGIESFIAALSDPKLEYEVLKRELPSLEAQQAMLSSWKLMCTC